MASTDDDAAAGIEIWRGGVNTWECDEMGHLNVRFYVAKAMEGLAGLAAELGMPHAFAPNAAATLVVREHHVRFLREARPGAFLTMRGGVLSLSDTEAELLQVLYHAASGEPCASFVTKVRHANPADGRAFPWPKRAAAAAESLKVALPPLAGARSISKAPATVAASGSEAERLGLTRIARAPVTPRNCDVFGRMVPEEFIGRVSDGIGALVAPLRQAVAEATSAPPARTGGAVLEYRILYLDYARSGDHIEIRSGLAGVDARTQRFGHWLLDPESGKALAVAEAVAVNFDLDARKALPISEAVQAAFAPHLRPQLRLSDS